jgi:hypothetical protein
MNIYRDKREDMFTLSSLVAMCKSEEREVLNIFEEKIKVNRKLRKCST